MSTLLLLLALQACSGGAPPDDAGKGDDQAEVLQDPRTLVEAGPVSRGSVGQHLVGSATVESEAQATLLPETTGVVTAIYAEEGDTVRKGQVLAVIANPTLEGGYERASTELARAQSEAAAAERLFAQGALSRTELDAAQSALKSARTAFDEATRTKGFTRLESPIDGTVATRGLRYGEIAGGTAAFTVVDLDRLRVVVSLPERDLARVRPGQTASLVSAYDDTSVATGKVTRVAPVVDSASGTFRVTVAVDPDQPNLRPGQFVSVRIEIDRHENVLTVPRRAIVWEEGRPFVYQVAELTTEELAKEKEDAAKKDDKGEGGGMSFSFGGKKEEEKPPPELPGTQRKANRVAVKLGYEDGELAEIVEGVPEGALVVTVGNESLRDAARVRLPTDPVLEAPKPEPEKEAAKAESKAGEG